MLSKCIKWYNKYTRHQGQMMQYVNTSYYYHMIQWSFLIIEICGNYVWIEMYTHVYQ